MSNFTMVEKGESSVGNYGREEEAKIVARMKAGDLAARDEFIACLQPFVRSLAARYATAYSWAASFLDFENILSELNYLLVVLLVEKNVGVLDNPSGYVRTALVGKISQYCIQYARPIKMPLNVNDVARSITAIVSLDQPMYDDSGRMLGETLADTLPDPGASRTAQTTEDDYRELYEAIDRDLTPRQRSVTNAAYSLNQTPLTSETEYAKQNGLSGIYFEECLRGAYAAMREGMARRAVPVQDRFANELAAWEQGYQTPRRLAKVLGVTIHTATRRMLEMRDVGLIQCHSYVLGKQPALVGGGHCG